MSKQQTNVANVVKSETDCFEQFIDLSASVIKPHSFSNY